MRRLLVRLGWTRRRAAHLEIGRRGERDAARHLRALGCRPIAKNLRTPGGEADLVCFDKERGAVMLVEVKARVRDGPEDRVPATAAIHAEKRRRLVAIARALRAHRVCRGRPIRIDVVTVEYASTADREPRIRHFPNAVTADGLLR